MTPAVVRAVASWSVPARLVADNGMVVGVAVIGVAVVIGVASSSRTITGASQAGTDRSIGRISASMARSSAAKRSSGIAPPFPFSRREIVVWSMPVNSSTCRWVRLA